MFYLYRHRSDETQHLENRNIQLQSENKCLKSELEALAVSVKNNIELMSIEKSE